MRCFGKSVFTPACALDYTSPAAQNAFHVKKSPLTLSERLSREKKKKTDYYNFFWGGGNFPKGWKDTGIFFKSQGKNNPV